MSYTFLCKKNFTKRVGVFLENCIQDLRKARKLSQAELADHMGVTRQTIISLEKGRYNASLELAFNLATYFDCLIEDIFLYRKDKN